MLREQAAAFADLPARVLWKLSAAEQEALAALGGPNLSANIKVPQPAWLLQAAMHWMLFSYCCVQVLPTWYM